MMSYQNRDFSETNFKDDYDEKFAEYSINEMPLYMSDADIDLCTQIHGNSLAGVKGGVVYRGMRIDSNKNLKELELIEDLINDNKRAFITLRLDSSSHDKGTAQSFQEYVKSYDMMTTLGEMKDAIKRGSSGEYGSYLITLKPTKDQVTYNTAKGTLTASAESEVILSGMVEVADIKIYRPLTKSNYLKFYDDLSLFNLGETTDFFVRWMSHHKLELPLKNQVNLINSQIKSYDDFVKFVGMASSYKDILLDYKKVITPLIKKSKYLPKFISKLTMEFDDNIRGFEINFLYGKKQMSIPAFIQDSMINGKYKKQFQRKVDKMFKDIKIKGFNDLLHKEFKIEGKEAIESKIYIKGISSIMNKLEDLEYIKTEFNIVAAGYNKLKKTMLKELKIHLMKIQYNSDFMAKFVGVILSNGTFYSRNIGRNFKIILELLDDKMIYLKLYKLYSGGDSVNKAHIEIDIVQRLATGFLELMMVR